MPEYRSIINPDAPQRPTLADCPNCEKDHTSWSGCWLAELGGILQGRGWSTADISEAIQKIPDIQEIYDTHIGPAVDALEAYLPTEQELEEQEHEPIDDHLPSDEELEESKRQARREAAADEPTERQIEQMMDCWPEPPMHFTDKDTLGRGGLS